MSRGVSDKITYKPYNQGEQWLLPPSLEELVPQNHFVRIVSKTVDELEIEKVFARNTKGGGASRYNPVMLLKVLIYCYMTGTYSSRQIAKQCRENVNVMWLTGFQKPDFRTINTFRSEKLKDSIEEIFVSTVKLLNRKGYVSLEKYFVDGTKIESAANKYTFVWKKAVEKNEKKLDEKLKVFLRDVEEITRKENQIYGDKDFAETGDDTPVTSEEIKAVAEQINKKLAEINDLDDEDSKDVKKKTEEGKTPDGRVIQRNGHWLEQKAKVKELLSSEEYKTLMKKRSTECETVFGQTKGNLSFRRFHLRGKEKVGTEWGLLMLGYDFKQLIRLINI